MTDGDLGWWKSQQEGGGCEAASKLLRRAGEKIKSVVAPRTSDGIFEMELLARAESCSDWTVAGRKSDPWSGGAPLAANQFEGGECRLFSGQKPNKDRHLRGGK